MRYRPFGFDLPKMGFVSSVGIRVLVAACKRTKASGGTFSVRSE